MDREGREMGQTEHKEERIRGPTVLMIKAQYKYVNEIRKNSVGNCQKIGAVGERRYKYQESGVLK